MKKYVITAIAGVILLVGGLVYSFASFPNGSAQLQGFMIGMFGGCLLVKGAGDAVVLLDDWRRSDRIKERKKAHVGRVLLFRQML